MESNDLAERAFAQAAVLNIVMNGIIRTLDHDQLASLQENLTKTGAFQEAALLRASISDGAVEQFSTLLAQMQQLLQDLLASPSGTTSHRPG
jgi:hypothetical protein